MCFVLWKEKLVVFCRLPRADKWLLLHAVARLACARIMIAALSFRRLSACLSGAEDATRLESDPEVLYRIGRAVSFAANNVPWRADCFPQVIAARMLLRRYGYTSCIHLGVARIGDDELTGHAWITCGETVVIGGELRERYTELYVLQENRKQGKISLANTE